MATLDILRLHYYERQFLGASDLEDQQAYLRDMRRRHNVGHHTWGIVVGLELVEKPADGNPGAVNVFVQPGMAVDGYGREIIVTAPVPLDPLLFDSFAVKQHRQVWIAYDQEKAKAPAVGYTQCDQENQYGRVLETYKFVIDPPAKTDDGITVNGKKATPAAEPKIPNDESVPYQEFPDDNLNPLWLVRLGTVNWDGVNHIFVPAQPPERLNEGRRYVGVVAGELYSPGDELEIRPRALPDDLSKVDMDKAPFAKVRGRLQVDGRLVAMKDVRIHGGKLHFLGPGGQDDNVPLWLQRTTDSSSTGQELRIHIGNAPKAENLLTIGPGDGGKEKPVLAVHADDTVEILTGSLFFGTSRRQMLNLFGKNYGLGIQDSTLYFRTNSDFAWFLKGDHSNTQSDPGSGGRLMMRLADDANLYFGADTRQMLNLWSNLYGIGVQSNTLYFRTDDDICWFRRGTHSNVRNDPGSGGVRAMRLDNASNLFVGGNITAHQNLIVDGNQNIFKVITRTFAVSNSGGVPAPWSYAHAGEFSQIYTAYAVLQGFSLFANNVAFNSWGHNQSVSAIPQHVFVRITFSDINSTLGSCYCAESDAGLESDNTVLFTVVVMGKPA